MCVDWSIGTTDTIMKDILHKSEKMVIVITGISNVLYIVPWWFTPCLEGMSHT